MRAHPYENDRKNEAEAAAYCRKIVVITDQYVYAEAWQIISAAIPQASEDE